MKVGDMVQLWRLKDNYVDREPTEHIGIVVEFHKYMPDAYVYVSGKKERFYIDALRVIAPAIGATPMGSAVPARGANSAGNFSL